LSFEGNISKDYKKKEMIKTFIGITLIIAANMLWIIPMLIGIDFEDANIIFPFELYIWIIILGGIVPLVLILIFVSIYLSAYVKRFSYKITEDKIFVNHGVLTRIRATIPFSRIQNITIVNGVFDRMVKTFTVKVETAGSSGAGGGQGGKIKPEGLIPGLKDPHIIEKKINEMMTKYSQIPSGLEDKIFKPEELAFDNFISYILSKMREGEKLKTTIKERMENANLTEAKLAEKVNVPIQTIQYLIEGRYNPSLALAYKIAQALRCKIEDLFELS
jgi:membrane protein YdbS with pleckstrin-like domain/DNA-binding XRE family transcriptional regulator